MDKKTWYIVVPLILLIFFFWQILEFFGLVKPTPTPSSVPTPDSTFVAGSADSLLRDTIPIGTPHLTLADSSRQIGSPFAADTAVAIDTFVITTNKYVATFITRGGGPISLKLREYFYKSGDPVEMLDGATEVTPDAHFAEGALRTSQLSFVANQPAGAYTVTNEPFDLTFTWSPPSGGAIVRAYRFHPDRYHFDLTVEVRDARALGLERRYSLVWNTPPGVAEPTPLTDYESMDAVAHMGGSRVSLNEYEDGRLDQHLDGAVNWAGVRNKYFSSVMILRHAEPDGVFAQGSKGSLNTPDGKIETRRIIAGVELALPAAEVHTDSVTVFVGPLDYSLMSEYHVQLEDMLDIGTTPVVGWIIKPFALAIIWLLPRMYEVVPNYGLVIILFALLVKIITLPLSMKSFKSMNAMRELQPKLEKLRKQYEKDPAALNREMMRMYKAHGVNPVSGCLPILPQMPLFFALFSVFRSTILLRQAPFVSIFDDLSRGATSFTDPYILLVLLMIATQFISQKLTMPTTQQNKIFLYLMPPLMGFLFYKFAAGLVLYWTCFSLFSLIDYFAFRRSSTVKNAEVQGA